MNLKYLVHRNQNDPAFNLALEEYALHKLNLTNHDYLLFYINAPSVIIGKHQHTQAEINQAYINQHHVKVVRRISGGGAVYQDLGNLNFSFITTITRHDFGSYQYFVQFIINALKRLGIQATLSGRNDIIVDGKKISGNAQYRYKNRMFSHGTLLFNTDLDALEQALNVSMDKIQSKGVASIRARVDNISNQLNQSINIMDFKKFLLEEIFGASYNTVELSEFDYQEIEKLSHSRYKRLDWNYDSLPAANITHSQRFDIGKIEFKMWLESGIIKMIKFYGDFFSQKDLVALESILTNQPYRLNVLKNKIEKINLKEYFGLIDHETFLNFLMAGLT